MEGEAPRAPVQLVRCCMLLFMVTVLTFLVMSYILPMCLTTMVVMVVMVMPPNIFCYLSSCFFKLFPYMLQGI